MSTPLERFEAIKAKVVADRNGKPFGDGWVKECPQANCRWEWVALAEDAPCPKCGAEVPFETGFNAE